jgi:hypothetical protein
LKYEQAKYPWLQRGMIYHLMSTLYSLVKNIWVSSLTGDRQRRSSQHFQHTKRSHN